MNRRHLPLLAAPLLCLPMFALHAAPWLAFTEVHYRPASDTTLEFVEIYNLDAPTVRLDGWSLEGAAHYEFAKGQQLGPRQCLVIARDLAAFQKRYPGVRNVVGPFRGELDNAGGRLTLRNAQGGIAAEMRYRRSGGWSALADGTGHSLVLADAHFDPLAAKSWKASDDPGGSPGRYEQIFETPRGEPIIRRGEEWRFLRGTTTPSNEWTTVAFDDSDWETGPSGFGYGDDDDATVLDDMMGRYIAVYTRKRFSVDDPAVLDSVQLIVDYDDAFIAYLNGKRVARSKPPGGGALPFGGRSMGHEAGRPESFPLGAGSSVLQAGENVLAVVGTNSQLQSSDFSLIVELEYTHRPLADDVNDAPILRLNEASLRVDAAGSGAIQWVELYNPSNTPVSVGKLFVTDAVTTPQKWRVPASVPIAGRGHLLVEIPADSAPHGPVVFLTDGTRLLDGLRWAPAERDGAEPLVAPEGASAKDTSATTLVCGRVPDGSRKSERLSLATPGEPNRLPPPSPLTITELHYHPIDPRLEFVELHNRSEREVSLSNYRFSRGVRYTFGESTTLAAGGYVVVARDPDAVRAHYGLAPAAVLGPYAGSLSNNGETITLSNAEDSVIDSVAYADRYPWPDEADGWGSSIELVDARLDNAMPTAWAASDARAASEWQDVTYRAGVYLFPGMSADTFQFLLLDAGECLIDDVQVKTPSGKLVLNEDFSTPPKADEGEKAARDPTQRWQGHGTHQDSRVSPSSPWAESPCFHLRASARGNSRQNYVSVRLDAPLEEDATYIVSYRVRWLRGCHLLLSRTSGQGLAKTQRLKRPTQLGTPGRPNSTAVDSGPILGIPSQSPVTPTSKEPVEVRVRASSSESLVDVMLLYRHASDSNWSTVGMSERTPGRWFGQIPAQAKGRVEFIVRARDRSGKSSVSPPGGMSRPAQYAVDLESNSGLPHYTVLITDQEWSAAQTRPRMSNRMMDATLVYGDSSIFYNVGFRARGSGFTRGSRNWRLVFGEDTLDGRAALTFDGQGQGSPALNERMTFWVLDQLGVPTPRQRYVHLNILGRGEDGMFEEVEKLNGDFLARWYSADEGTSPTRLHKVDDYWDFGPPGPATQRAFGFGGGPRFFRGRGGGRGAYSEAFMDYQSDDAEDYRWNFPPRANGNDEDFVPLMALLRFLDEDETDAETFRARLNEVIDVDAWCRILAARTVANDWDSFGLQRGKNAYVFRNPAGRWELLPWDSDLSWGGFGRFNRFGNEGGSGGGVESLISNKFPAVRRILSEPEPRRRFLSHLSFLIKKRMGDDRFGAAVTELEAHIGSRGDIRGAAEMNRERIAAALPSYPFSVTAVERLDGGKVRLAGEAPLLASRFRVGTAFGTVRFSDSRHWTAEFALDGSLSDLSVEALDADGDVVAKAPVLPRGGE